MNLQKYTWYNQKAELQNSDTVHQVLSLGRIEEIKKMISVLGLAKVQQIFLETPKKFYYPEILNFISRYVLQVEGEIDESRYLKNTSRSIK